MIINKDGNICDTTTLFPIEVPTDKLLSYLRDDVNIKVTYGDGIEIYEGVDSSLFENNYLKIIASGHEFKSFLNGRPHSFNGLPARRVSSPGNTGVSYFCKHGLLNNLMGPALIKNSDDLFFAIGGKMHNLSEYICKNPQSLKAQVDGREIFKLRFLDKEYLTLKSGNDIVTLVKKNDVKNFKKKAIISTLFDGVLANKLFLDYEIEHFNPLSLNAKNIYRLMSNSLDLRVQRNISLGVRTFTGVVGSNVNYQIDIYDNQKNVFHVFFPSLGRQFVIENNSVFKFETGDKMSSIQFDDVSLNSLLDDLFKEDSQKAAFQERVKVSDRRSIHNEEGPSVTHPDGTMEYSIYGNKITREEFQRYNPSTKRIEFYEGSFTKVLHRTNGPAVIQFHPDGSVQKSFWRHGNKVSEYADLGVDIIDAGYFKINSDANKTNVAPATKQVADGAAGWKRVAPGINSTNATTGSFFTMEESSGHDVFSVDNGGNTTHTGDIKKMYEEEIEETEYILERSQPDLAGSRISQIWEGGKFGFKKGVINTSSKMLAQKLVDLTPLADKVWATQMAQLVILLGSAELINVMPDAVRDAVRMEEETQRDLVSFLRAVSGENIGREAVSLALGVLPHIKDLLTDFSKEDLQDLANEYENTAQKDVSQKSRASLDPAQKRVDLEDLIKQASNVEVEQKEVEHVTAKR